MRPKHIYTGDYSASYIHNMGYFTVISYVKENYENKRPSRPLYQWKVKEILRKSEYERTSRHAKELLQPFKDIANFLPPEEGTYNSLVTSTANEIISHGRELVGNYLFF